MNAKTIIAWVGLSIVAALIVCVLVLSFVPTKIMPTFENKPSTITIYKSNDSNTESYLIDPNATAALDYQEAVTNYNNIFAEVDKLGVYSVLDTLFMGVLGQSYKVQSNGSDTSKDKTTLLSDYDYLVELTWNESQQIKNADGSDFTDSSTTSSARLKFYRAIIGVKNTDASAEVNIYLYYLKSSSSTTYYSYVAYANTNALYNYVNAINDNKFAPN